jgi:hypothetical protein
MNLLLRMNRTRKVLCFHGAVVLVVLAIFVPVSLLGLLPKEMRIPGHAFEIFCVAYGLLGGGASLAAQLVSAVPSARRRMSEEDLATLHYVATQCVTIALLLFSVR